MREPRSERHFGLENFGGCQCSLGRAVCNCFIACEVAANEPEDRSWFWSTLTIAVIGVASIAALVLGLL